MTAHKNPLPNISSSEMESFRGSRSDLILPGLITCWVDELSINDLAQSRIKVTYHPIISADDIISGMDHVSRSIAKCIKLTEAALRRLNDSARRFPHGLSNNSVVYSDQIRVLEMLPPSPELERVRTRLHVTAAQAQHLRKEYSAPEHSPATLAT
jgi:hypothetical protein